MKFLVGFEFGLICQRIDGKFYHVRVFFIFLVGVTMIYFGIAIALYYLMNFNHCPYHILFDSSMLLFKFVQEDHKQPIFGVQFYTDVLDSEEDPFIFGTVGSNRVRAPIQLILNVVQKLCLIFIFTCHSNISILQLFIVVQLCLSFAIFSWMETQFYFIRTFQSVICKCNQKRYSDGNLTVLSEMYSCPELGSIYSLARTETNK